MLVDGKHLEFRCAVCGGPASFGFGCNLLKTPPRLGAWYCGVHRSVGEAAIAAEAAAIAPAKPTQPAEPQQVGAAPATQVRSASPTQWSLL